MQTKYDFFPLKVGRRDQVFSLFICYDCSMSQALLLWRHAVISFDWVNIYPQPVPRLSHSAFTPAPGPGKFPCPDSSRPIFVCNGLSALTEEAAAFIWAQISAGIWIICTIIAFASETQTPISDAIRDLSPTGDAMKDSSGCSPCCKKQNPDPPLLQPSKWVFHKTNIHW